MLLRLAVGLIFIVVPMLELMLLIRIGQSIGMLATTALVLGTALTGAFIVSRQSMAVITRTLEAASEGRPPVEPVLDGLFLMVAGVLLLTPGLITDMVALALLVPAVRRAVARGSVQWLLRRADVRMATYTRDEAGSGPGPQPGSGPERQRPSAGLGDGPVIEGEFERVDERPVSSRKGPHRNGRPASRT